MLRKGNPEGNTVPVTVKDRVEAGDVVRVRFSETGEDANRENTSDQGLHGVYRPSADSRQALRGEIRKYR